jgi:hypothetical protein
MVTVQFKPGAFQFKEEGGQSHDVLDLTLAAVDSNAKLSVLDSQVKLDLKPRTRQLVDALGFRCVSHIDLVPGRYQLRILGRAQNSGKVGSVYYDLEVPEFAKSDLALSGLALSSATAALVPTAGAFEPMKDVMPGPPTVARDFFSVDTLSLVAEVYDKQLANPHTLDIVTSVRDDAGHVVFHADQQRKSEELRSIGGGSFIHKALIPLQDLAPGSYTLKLEVASRLGKHKTAQRELLFRVVPPPPKAG